MYFDEDVVLELRLNSLDKYVDYFVIVESEFTHKGDKRNLKFNHKKFEKFKNKIIYKIYNEPPKDIELVNNEDNEFKKLNVDYKNKFNFPFIIAVKGKHKTEILNSFKQRIQNSLDEEFFEAKKQVKKIASLRLEEILK